MAFKKDMTALHTRGKKGSIIKHEGKGATEQKLPHRNAMTTLTRGAPADRTMNAYAKATPDNDAQASPDMLSGSNVDTDAFLTAGRTA